MEVDFPGNHPSDLYVWIVKHWDCLKEKYGVYSMSEAAKDFTDKYGQSKGRFFRFFMVLIDRLIKRSSKKLSHEETLDSAK
jgi:predicted AlkP superfamily pyrophosphatase or phosphodiesterase